MRRNCALTPSQLLKFYIVLVAASIAVATGFLMMGVWMILVFTCIELTAVTVGFLIYCRHALDFEEIQIDNERLVIKKFIGYKESMVEFNVKWIRITPPELNAKVFFIGQSDQQIEIGQFLKHEQQIHLISSLKRHLQ